MAALTPPPAAGSEKHLKVNMTWNDNATVTYMQVKTWHFEPHLSDGRLDDNITSLNVPLLVRVAPQPSVDNTAVKQRWGSCIL